MSLTPGAMRRLMKEISTLRASPPDGVRIVTNEEDMFDITGIVAGPEGTPYEGGYFKIRFQFTEEFPAAPPKCTMLTRIFHPNVSKSGEICVNTLKKDWKKEYGIAHILITIKCLLICPNAESALDEAAGKLLLEDYDGYFKHAKLITQVHAKPKVRPPEFDIPSASSNPSTHTFQSDSSPSAAHPASTSRSPPPASNSTSIPLEIIPPTNAVTPAKSMKTSASSNMHLAPSEHTEPLQLSPSNNNNSSKIPSDLSPTIVTGSSVPSLNGSASGNKHPSGGPLQPAAVGNASTEPSGVVLTKSLKRTVNSAGGVSKRKKGLKRL